MATIKNTIIFNSGVLTNPTTGTVLYDYATTGDANGKGIADIQITASAPITVDYITIYGIVVTGQVLTLTNPFSLGSTAINHIELSANLTGTLELVANELMQ